MATPQRELKVFGATMGATQGPVVVPFGLNFIKLATGEAEVHEFATRCVPGDAGMVLALSSVAHVGPDGKRTTDLNGMLAFFRQVMDDENLTKLSEMLFERRDITIHIDALSEVIMWLIEEYSGRPTELPAPSSAGPRRTGRPSTAEPSLAAVTS